jgi:hypothetical protein
MTQRPPIPPPPYNGGCLCGAVRWRLDARPLAINACHCQDCKRLSGGTNFLTLIAHRTDLHTQGETHFYRKRADSGREGDIHRCAVCGTRMWHAPLTAPTLIFVVAGTLDDSSWVVPTSHIWVERLSPGVVIQDDAVKVEGQPADRRILMDAFNAIHGAGT